MIADAMKANITGQGEPKSREELIALARAIRAEFATIHGHMDRILTQANMRKAA